MCISEYECPGLASSFPSIPTSPSLDSLSFYFPPLAEEINFPNWEEETIS